MFQLRSETFAEFRARYRAVMEQEDKDRYRMGTKAMSGGKKPFDISRDTEDYFFINVDQYTRPEDDDNYYGRWLTGFGFFNVQFPKATSRELTDEEWEWLLDNPVVMG